MMDITKMRPRINGQRSGDTREAKYSMKTITAAPTTAPYRELDPPIMVMTIG
jgi:hypothetical protein